MSNLKKSSILLIRLSTKLKIKKKLQKSFLFLFSLFKKISLKELRLLYHFIAKNNIK